MKSGFNYGLAAADFNNDAQEDFFVCNYTDPRLYTWIEPADGSPGYFKNIIAEVMETVPTHVYAAAWGDMNHDGWVDLALVGSFDEPLPPIPGIGPDNVHIYKNLGGKLKLEFFGPVPSDGTKSLAAPSSFSVSWTDVNADNLLDIFVCNADAGLDGSKIYVNGGYVQVTTGYGFFDESSSWFGLNGGPEQVVHAEFLDFDSDGDRDLIVARAGTEDNLQFYRNNVTSFSKLELALWPVGEFPQALNGLITEDFDQDGDIDIMTIPSSANEKPRLLMNSGGGGGYWEAADSGLPAGIVNRGMSFNWLGAEPSVFLAKAAEAGSDTVTEFFYSFMKDAGGAQEGFITIKMDPHAAGIVNSSGIGTKVIVAYNGKIQYHWLDGGSGHGSQNSRTLVLGLGEIVDPTAEASVVVEWPNGAYTGYTGLPFTTVMLSDSSSLTATSVAGYYLPGVGDNWIVFEWDAPYPTTADVIIEEADNITNTAGCACVVPLESIVINPKLSDVTLEVTQVEENLYHHTMIWTGRCCYQNCKYKYTLNARLNNLVSTHPGTLGTGKICAQNPPPGN